MVTETIDSTKLVYPAMEYHQHIDDPPDWKRVFGDANYSLMATGRTGCLKSDTLIQTSEGIKKISDCDAIFDVWSYNFQKSRKELKKAIKIHSGKKNLFRITLEDGRTVLASSDHVFFKQGSDLKVKEVSLKKLRTGDRLISE